MTSRQRLLAALRGDVPDRVPVTLYELSHLNDDWANKEPSYQPLLDLERQYGDSFVQAPIDVPVLLGDPNAVRGGDEQHEVGSVVRNTRLETPKGELTAVARRDPGQMTYWQIKPIVTGDEDIERVLAIPDPPETVDVARLRQLEARVGEEGILCFNLGDAIGHVVGLFDFEDFVMRCALDDGPIMALLEKAQHQVMRSIRTIAEHVENAVFRLWGPEYCASPLMNPQVYFRKYVVEQDKAAAAAIRQSGNFAVIHSHGKLKDILDMIADIQADALEPIETLPLATADVTLAEVKAKLGKNMTLMGAIQAVTLERGTPNEVREAVRQAIDEGAAGGRFVLFPTAGPFMVPLEPTILPNAEIMYRTAHELGGY